MAFPTTGILDNFNRANEGPPPSSSWTNLDAGTFTGSASVVGNICDGTGLWGYYWNPAQFGADCEAYLTTLGTGEYYCHARIQSPGSSAIDGYSVRWKASVSEIYIQRIDNETWITLGAVVTGQTQTSTDKLGIEIIGTTIKAYKDIGAGWVEVASRTDSTYASAGYIGMSSSADNNIDNFGGGTLVAAATEPTFLPTQPFLRW